MADCTNYGIVELTGRENIYPLPRNNVAKCTYCGQKTKEDRFDCPHCGAPLESEPQQFVVKGYGKSNLNFMNWRI